jgi:threonylcarbamoyladenosine tRNA methylthiotransferase MtaB
MKYAVITFGCRVNQADSLSIIEELRARGAVPSAARDADLVLVNTCTVTAAADERARGAIRRVARDNPDATIVVTGCYATSRPAEVRAIPGVARLLANDQKSHIAAVLAGDLGVLRPDADSRALRPGLGGRTAFTLCVQRGCDRSCAYCIVPATRGRPRSSTIGEVLRRVGQLAASGYKEIALTGVHLGAYGRDLTPRSSLVELLRALDECVGGSLVRLGSLEPADCSSGVVDLVTRSPRFAPHFHLPLQHASDAVLVRMRRPYTIDFYSRLVDGIRWRIPHAAIGSDVIVGFPGETDAEFQALEDYLERSPLSRVHVFPYSDRPGTEASRLAGKVPDTIVRQRARRLRLLAKRLDDRFRRSQVGSTRRGLTIEDGSLVVTDNYLKVRIPPGHSRNEWVSVRVLEAGEQTIGKTEGNWEMGH